MPYVSDDDSSSYDSDESCSSEEDDKLGMLGHFMKKEDEKKKSVTDFEAFGAGDDGTVVQKMNTLLALRAQLGMDDDQSFMAEQERKNAEKKKLDNMSAQDRLKYSENKAGDAMEKAA